MKAQILILIIFISLVSCRKAPVDGKYFVYSAKPSGFNSNYFYSEEKSVNLSDYLTGREFEFQFSNDLVTLSGYDTKKVTFNIDKGYDIPSIKSKHYASFPKINGYDHNMHLSYGNEEKPDELYIRLRVKRNNNFRDTSMVTTDDSQFAEVDLKLKNLTK
jgi:hypothetical protein